MEFDYDQAFSRNIGIISKEQQAAMRKARVAIAGMGAVGGQYIITLTRAGIGNFHIADFDNYDIVNFNRQYGANMTTIGQAKTGVMARMAREINPELDIVSFDTGVTDENLDEFLKGVDVVVDGIDFFCVDAHKRLIDGAVERGLTVVAAVPLGFGAGMLSFNQAGMSFDDYFTLTLDQPLEHQVLLLSLGFAPAGFHIKYVDPDAFDLKNRKGPSFSGAVSLCSGMIATQVYMALFYPEKIRPVPNYTHFDARLNKFKRGRLWLGNKNPLQRLKYAYARRLLGI